MTPTVHAKPSAHPIPEAISPKCTAAVAHSLLQFDHGDDEHKPSSVIISLLKNGKALCGSFDKLIDLVGEAKEDETVGKLEPLHQEYRQLMHNSKEIAEDATKSAHHFSTEIVDTIKSGHDEPINSNLDKLQKYKNDIQNAGQVAATKMSKFDEICGRLESMFPLSKTNSHRKIKIEVLHEQLAELRLQVTKKDERVLVIEDSLRALIKSEKGILQYFHVTDSFMSWLLTITHNDDHAQIRSYQAELEQLKLDLEAMETTETLVQQELEVELAAMAHHDSIPHAVKNLSENIKAFAGSLKVFLGIFDQLCEEVEKIMKALPIPDAAFMAHAITVASLAATIIKDLQFFLLLL